MIDFRAVDTPSAWAVRQPIYGSSIARWKSYRPHVQPLLDVLSEVGLAADRADVIGFRQVQAAVG